MNLYGELFTGRSTSSTYVQLTVKGKKKKENWSVQFMN